MKAPTPASICSYLRQHGAIEGSFPDTGSAWFLYIEASIDPFGDPTGAIDDIASQEGRSEDLVEADIRAIAAVQAQAPQGGLFGALAQAEA